MPAEPMPGADGVTVERNVPCRARDGVTLYADVYRPFEGGPHPVLLMREPYDKNTGQTGSGYAHPSWWAAKGYVTVVQDCRGRFRSEGDWYPFLHEGPDGYDAVEWAARLAGADGRVGMYGYSYPGATQLLAAAQRPPSLVTICPGFTSSGYHEGWTYRGGAFALAFAANWAAGLAFDTARRAGDAGGMAALAAAPASADWFGGLPLDGLGPLTCENAPYFYDWLEHPAYDDYWRGLAVAEGRIEVPGLHVGGWWDTFLAGTVASFAEIERSAGRQKLVVGPWIHCPWKPLAGAGDDAGPAVVNEWQLRWLDCWLKGRDSGVLAAPVTAYVLNDGWHDFDGWPPSHSEPAEWYLHSSGRANSRFGDGVLSTDPPGDDPPDVFVYDPLAPVASLGGHSCCDETLTPMGPRSQAGVEVWGDVLVYTTEPLAEDLTLLGDASLILHAASSALDTDFTARLCVVDPEGESVNLQEGIVRARFRRSTETPELLTPGRVEEYRIALGPVGARIPAGHRLRLNVSSSDFPQWDRNLNTGGPLGGEGREAAIVATQTVRHDRRFPSRLVLPVCPGGP
jgi:putative CocE/NonD family hydrolase